MLIIIQARLRSTRLPCKVLLPFRDGSILSTIVESCETVGPTIVACPQEDYPIIKRHLGNSVSVEAPDVHMTNVLGRFSAVARQWSEDWIVRVTGDCPLWSPHILRDLLATREDGYDYISNVYPHRCSQKGLDTEIFSREILLAADECTDLGYDREHVTPWIQRNGRCLNPWPEIEDKTNYSVDTIDDYLRLASLEMEDKPWS